MREFELGGWINIPVDGDNVASTGFVTESVKVTGGTGNAACAGSGGTFGVSNPRAPRVQLSSANDGPWMSFQRRTLVHHRFSSPFGAGWGVEEIGRAYTTGDIAVLVHGDGQQEDFRPRASARLFPPGLGLTEHAYARDMTTGEIFVAYAPGTIASLDLTTGTLTPILSGLAFSGGSLQGLAVAYVGSARHFVLASQTRLDDIDASGVLRLLATRSGQWFASSAYAQASVAARGDLVFYTDGREDGHTIQRLRLSDATPALVDASVASGGDVKLNPTATLSGVQFENPHGLAFGLDGVLYVTDPRRHVVYRVLPDISGDACALSSEKHGGHVISALACVFGDETVVEFLSSDMRRIVALTHKESISLYPSAIPPRPIPGWGRPVPPTSPAVAPSERCGSDRSRWRCSARRSPAGARRSNVSCC